jgi:hypothetical protein
MITINAVAQRYEATQVWTAHSRLYMTRHSNRKRAIKWALAKIEAEFPGFPEYEATIIENK